jgi:pimeloyl-ACP methyl ester carboxylesterase
MPLAELLRGSELPAGSREAASGELMAPMRYLVWTIVVLGAMAGPVAAHWTPGLHGQLRHVNGKLHGQVLDFTHNHGSDRRIWSAALEEKRDLYVYLPPGFDPARQYPLAIFLHGATQDEQFFLRVVPYFDQAIACGKLPPFILAAPDGSLQGKPSWHRSASFWANTRAGHFEDFVMTDVWNFLLETFPIRPEREAHALVGVSMGGAGAFALAIKHRDRVKIAIGFMPALNVRWVDCHDKYNRPFDPCCWGWRTKLNECEVIGRPAPFLKMRFKVLFDPLIGRGCDAIAELSRINPIEIMDEYDLRDGELDLFIGYGGKDEFNIPAHVESFLYRAKERGVTVGVTYDPNGHHNLASGKKLLPPALEWIAPLVEPYYTDPPANRP